MWKTIGAALVTKSAPNAFLSATDILQNQLRVSPTNSCLNRPLLIHFPFQTTFILRRKNPPEIDKKGYIPKLNRKNFVYELVKDTNNERQPDLELILTDFVEGVGNLGEKVSVRPNFGYERLLLPGLAVYASPENIEKYATDQPSEKEKHSSVYALLVSISINKNEKY